MSDDSLSASQLAKIDVKMSQLVSDISVTKEKQEEMA